MRNVTVICNKEHVILEGVCALCELDAERTRHEMQFKAAELYKRERDALKTYVRHLPHCRMVNPDFMHYKGGRLRDTGQRGPCTCGLDTAINVAKERGE